MKYVDEYRDRFAAEGLAGSNQPPNHQALDDHGGLRGQTHAIVRFGLDQLLPEKLTLVHGPGCPVCVTPIALIDQAVALALLSQVIFCTFGDMLRVPGSRENLFAVKTAGGDVRIVYSPLDALKLAQAHPEREIICFAVGFETTAPAYAMAVTQAKRLGLTNFSLLAAHVLVPPAMEAILSAPGNRVQGFLAAGHVCTIMGYEEYEALAARYRVPIVVTGFEPLDVLEGVAMLVGQLEEGRAEVENQYVRSVRRQGNEEARGVIEEVFEPSSRAWRGIGNIPGSGLRLEPAYGAYDAAVKFRRELDAVASETQENSECRQAGSSSRV